MKAIKSTYKLGSGHFILRKFKGKFYVGFELPARVFESAYAVEEFETLAEAEAYMEEITK